MSKYKESNEISNLISLANNILIIQGDNPDGDSLGSSLALEQIFGDLGKNPSMYCGIEIPNYLRYLKGWDRVSNEISNNIDLTVIVDCNSLSLLDTLAKGSKMSIISSKPVIVIDHHVNDISIPFATVICNQIAASTGEVIYELSQDLNWHLNLIAKQMISTSILSDSLGLISESTTARTIHILAELVDTGVKLGELEEARRELMKKSPELIRYKGVLLQRIEYHLDNSIAMVTIPWDEIEKFSYSYNPSMLVIDDMRLTENTKVAIAFKVYKDGKITAKIRSNYGYPIAAELAKHFGGNGHPYASGFKLNKTDKTIEDVKAECINVLEELIDKLT